MGRVPDSEWPAKLDSKRAARMATVDQMTPDMRALVHEYGLNIVKACHDLGLVQPRHIRHIVETVLNDFSPTRGSYVSQGIRSPFIATPDEQEARG